jgi:hypothetical protein
MIISPTLEKPPTMTRREESRNPTTANDAKRTQLLEEKLRFDQMTEGANEIRKICEE